MVFFSGATERTGLIRTADDSLSLIQHVFQLLFGIALKSNELDAVPIVPVPPNDGERDDDRRPGTGRLHLQMKMGADRNRHLAHDLTACDREISEYPFTGNMVAGDENWIVDSHSLPRPWLHIR